MIDIRHLQVAILNILLYSLFHPEHAEQRADELADRVRKRGNSQDAFLAIRGCGNLLGEDKVAVLVEQIAENPFIAKQYLSNQDSNNSLGKVLTPSLKDKLRASAESRACSQNL
jgi:hypothetical protein